MKTILLIFSLLFLFAVSVNAAIINYDNFSVGPLNSTKWSEVADPEGQPFTEEHSVDLTLKHYHVENTNSGDKRIILNLTNYTFKNRDILEYDVNYSSGSGNRAIVLFVNNKPLDVHLSNNLSCNLCGSIGINSQEFDIGNQFGNYHFKLEFLSNGFNLNVLRPNNTTYSKFVPFTMPVNIGFETWSNGAIHVDYDNFIINSFDNFKTNISTSPFNPNGLNNWYITEPLISLERFEPGKTFYRFGDSGIWQTYSVPFRRSNTLDSIQNLFYFTNFSDNVTAVKTEFIQNLTLIVDLQKPVIKKINPVNNSFVSNSVRIFASISEVLLGTSGINLSSIKLFLDTSLLNPTISQVGTLNANITTQVNSLGNGLHIILLTALDYAGNNGSLTWVFNVDSTNPSQLNVISPVNANYGERAVLFNLTISEKIKNLYLVENQKTSVLCTNCNNLVRKINFKEGQHDIKLIASDNASNNLSKDVSFFVDSRPPRILKINFKNETKSKSTLFDVNYNEALLKGINFYYEFDNTRNIVALQNCLNGTKTHCNLSISSSGLDGKKVTYYFEVLDKARSVFSKKQEITFDFTAPALSILDPDQTTFDARRIRFDLKSNEKLSSLSYKDNNKNFKNLCIRCSTFNNSLSFTNGTHTIIFNAVDIAGNSNIFIRTFTIN